jgi:hypothetical protein
MTTQTNYDIADRLHEIDFNLFMLGRLEHKHTGNTKFTDRATIHLVELSKQLAEIKKLIGGTIKDTDTKFADEVVG